MLRGSSAMRASLIVRVIRSAVDRRLAGERDAFTDKHAAELAAIWNGTWIDPETGSTRATGVRTRLLALNLMLDLMRVRRRRLVVWPREARGLAQTWEHERHTVCPLGASSVRARSPQGSTP